MQKKNKCKVLPHHEANYYNEDKLKTEANICLYNYLLKVVQKSILQGRRSRLRVP